MPRNTGNEENPMQYLLKLTGCRIVSRPWDNLWSVQSIYQDLPLNSLSVVYVPSHFWKPSPPIQFNRDHDNLETSFTGGRDSLRTGLLRHATWLYDWGSILLFKYNGGKLQGNPLSLLKAFTKKFIYFPTFPPNIQRHKDRLIMTEFTAWLKEWGQREDGEDYARASILWSPITRPTT